MCIRDSHIPVGDSVPHAPRVYEGRVHNSRNTDDSRRRMPYVVQVSSPIFGDTVLTNMEYMYTGIHVLLMPLFV